MSNLAIIQATPNTPEIKYVQSKEIEIIGYDKFMAAAKADVASYIPEGFDGTISDEGLSRVTPEQVKQVKEIRKALNKKVKALSDKRIEVKNQYMIPVTVFEDDMKVLTGEYKGASDKATLWLNAIEERRVHVKNAEMREYWEAITILPIAIDFSKVKDPKWDNKSESMAVIERALDEKAEKIINDLTAIERNCGSYITECKAVYIDTLSLSAAMQKFENLNAAAERAQRLAEQREALKAQQEAARAEIPVEAAVQASSGHKTTVRAELSPMTEQDAPHMLTLRFTGPAKAMELFKNQFRELVRAHPAITCEKLEES